MGDEEGVPAPGWLQSHYRTERAPDGRLVIHAASPLSPILGCAIPALVAVLLLVFFRAAGAGALIALFALAVIGALAYNGSRVWICAAGTIQTAHALGGLRPRSGSTQAVRSVVLKRELWRADAGSTDTIYVMVQPAARLKIVSVHNWVGRESRVASGGTGSLARSGPVVASAPSPLRPWANETLMPAVSDAVSELADVLTREMEVPVIYECEKIGTKPRGR